MVQAPFVQTKRGDATYDWLITFLPDKLWGTGDILSGTIQNVSKVDYA